MNKFLLQLILGFAFASEAFAADCGKEVMGGCQSTNYNGSAMHLHGNAARGAEISAKREQNDAEAHQIAQKLIAQAEANNKAAAQAEANKSLVQKMKDKLTSSK